MVLQANHTKEFCIALKDELREWITQIDQILINQTHDALVDKEPLSQLFTEYYKMMQFTRVEHTTPAQLLNGQIFLFVDNDEYAYIVWRHHTGYLEVIGPEPITAACRNLEYRLDYPTQVRWGQTIKIINTAPGTK